MAPAAAAAGDEWERRIDDLMERQTHTTDERMRKQLFDEVQQIFAEHVPIVHFVAPNVKTEGDLRRLIEYEPVIRVRFLSR